MRRYRKQLGSSLVEYVVPIGLMVLTIIPALPTLLNAMNKAVGETLFADALNGGKLELYAFGEFGKTGAGQGKSNVNSANSKIAIQLADGSIIYLDDYATDPSGNIETAGVNGATSQWTRLLSELATKLVDKGELTSAQAQTLMDLANQGHKIAEIQRLLEQAAKAAGTNLQAFKDARIFYNDRMYSPQELSGLIGWSGLAPGQVDPIALNSSNRTGSIMTTFHNLYTKAFNDGSLSDKAVKKVVESLSKDIAMSGEIMEHTVYTTKNPSDLATAVASLTTHYNSGGICATGNGKSNGVKCLSNKNDDD